MQTERSLVVITWDGKAAPLDHILVDATPQFDILVFDHSAKKQSVEVEGLSNLRLLSKSTENKGQVFAEVYKYLYEEQQSKYKYIGVLDDDLFVSISDLNKILFIANLEKLDVFQPSITEDSYHDHQRFLHKPGVQIVETGWIEIMCPFYKEDLFKGIYPYCHHTVSGQGIDVYLIPCLQKLMGLTKTAVVHAVQIKHCRPIQSGNKIYSNGKNNLQEIESIRNACLELVKENGSGVFDDHFVKTVLEVDHFKRNSLIEKWNRLAFVVKNFYKELIKLSYR